MLRNLLIALFCASATLACTGIAHTDTTMNATTSQNGFSPGHLQRLSDMNRRYINDKQVPGIVTLVARDGEIVHFEAHGVMGLDNKEPIRKDTLFRIYSMTKPVTAVAAMILFEEGRFHMTDPVARHLPEFADQKLLVDGKLVTPASPMTMTEWLLTG